jgi:hypothetical protein
LPPSTIEADGVILIGVLKAILGEVLADDAQGHVPLSAELAKRYVLASTSATDTCSITAKPLTAGLETLPRPVTTAPQRP